MFEMVEDSSWPRANFQFWIRRTRWHAAEAAALLLGREPRENGGSTREARTTGGDTAANRQFWQLVSLLSEAQEIGDVDEPDWSTRYIEWADRMEIPFPDELRDAARFMAKVGMPQLLTPEIQAHIETLERENLDLIATIDALVSGSFDTTATDQTDEASPGVTRKYGSLQRITLAMAAVKFRYRPADAKSPAPKNIADTTELAGLRVTDDTVRKRLREAAEDLGWTGEDLGVSL